MNLYAPSTARFDTSARALTEAELMKVAPSVFAVDAHESRSERFQPIPTIEILRGLMAEGFQPVGARQSRTRDASKRDYTKHAIRLRRLDDGRNYSVGDTVFEIILKNANDGTAAYDLMAGLFRIRCLNSLVTQTATLDSLKVRHTGTPEAVRGKVIDGTYQVLKSAEIALAAPQDWGTIQLDRDEKQAFAEAAHVIRFGDGEDEDASNAAKAFQPQQLLLPRRHDDRADDFWTQFNVVQENVIRGGLRARHRVNGRRPAMREVKGIDQDIKLNKALWILGQRMAELKGMKAAA
jgi:hypothetical protein